MTKTDTLSAGRQPDYFAYHVIDGGHRKGRWSRIGAYFAHEDAKGGTLLLDSLPVAFDGRIVLRLPKSE